MCELVQQDGMYILVVYIHSGSTYGPLTSHCCNLALNFLNKCLDASFRAHFRLREIRGVGTIAVEYSSALVLVPRYDTLLGGKVMEKKIIAMMIFVASECLCKNLKSNPPKRDIYIYIIADPLYRQYMQAFVPLMLFSPPSPPKKQQSSLSVFSSRQKGQKVQIASVIYLTSALVVDMLYGVTSTTGPLKLCLAQTT